MWKTFTLDWGEGGGGATSFTIPLIRTRQVCSSPPPPPPPFKFSRHWLLRAQNPGQPKYCYPTPSGSQWGRGRELNSALPTAGALNVVSQGTGSIMPGWSKTVVITIHGVVHWLVGQADSLAYQAWNNCWASKRVRDGDSTWLSRLGVSKYSVDLRCLKARGAIIGGK